MAHVKISTGEGVKGCARIEVDGVDVSSIVGVDGFGVEFPNHPDGVVTVYMPVIPSRLDLDLPDAMLAMIDIEADR